MSPHMFSLGTYFEFIIVKPLVKPRQEVMTYLTVVEIPKFYTCTKQIPKKGLKWVISIGKNLYHTGEHVK